MPSVEVTAKLSDRLTVVLRELTARETFTSDSLMEAVKATSGMAMVKVYALCSVRKIIFTAQDGTPKDEWYAVNQKAQLDRLLDNPILDGKPLTGDEMNNLMKGFRELDGEIADPNAEPASPEVPAGGLSLAP